MTKNQLNTTELPETISPAAFPIGSVRSRAAARAVAEERRARSKRWIEYDLRFLTTERAREVLTKAGTAIPENCDPRYLRIRIHY
jgi:hypothetical protein